MKTIAFLFFLCIVTTVAAEEREMLLGGELDIGGFGSPILKFTNINDKNTFLVGGQGFVLLNHRFYLGGGGGGTASDIGDGVSSYSYGGLIVGAFINPNKALHYFTDLGVYSGNMSFNSKNSNNVDNSADDFLIVEPSVGVALNVMRYCKITLGVSYRVVSSVDSPNISKNDVGGYAISGALLFGKF